MSHHFDVTVDPLEIDWPSSSGYSSIDSLHSHQRWDDSKERHRFRMSLPKDPDVKEWVRSLSKDERKELGL